MQADLNRMSWFAALTLFLGAMGPAVSRADDLQAGEVLKGQGLKRSAGSTWVLAGEAVILKDVRTASDLSKQLRNAQEQQQALEMGNQNPQVFIDNYRQQIDWCDQRISEIDRSLTNLGPSGGNQAATVWRNMLIQERNALVAEQRRLSALIRNLADQRGQFQDVKQQFNAEVARQRESYMQAISGLRKSVDEIMAKYTELSGTEEISEGPQGSFRIVQEHAEAWPIERAHDRHQVAGKIRGLGSHRDRRAAPRKRRRPCRCDGQRQGTGQDGLRHRRRADDLVGRARLEVRPQADRPHGPVRGRRREQGHGQGNDHSHGLGRPVERQ